MSAQHHKCHRELLSKLRHNGLASVCVPGGFTRLVSFDSHTSYSLLLLQLLIFFFFLTLNGERICAVELLKIWKDWLKNQSLECFSWRQLHILMVPSIFLRSKNSFMSPVQIRVFSKKDNSGVNLLNSGFCKYFPQSYLLNCFFL